jgi:hypothetical protein
MSDLFDGDPLITIGADGAEMEFKGGQPVMDQGFDNHVNFSLLTYSGHWSEDLETLEERKYKGLFLESAKKPVTRQSLIDTDRAAELDVEGDEFGTVLAETTNPTSDSLRLEMTFTPPTGDLQKLLLERTGQNWVSLAGNN